MEDDQLPKYLFYTEFQHCRRQRYKQKMRFKYDVKNNFRAHNIDIVSWE